jgi:hypothetical protein
MTIRRSFRAAALVGLVLVSAFAWVSSAQAPRGGAAAATTDSDLLVEIRGLRADLNQALGTNIRAQLLVGRLQLQEQRINVISRQLAEVRRQLAAVETGQVMPTTEVKRLEDALGGPLAIETQRGLEANLSRIKAQLMQAQREEQRLRLQEMELAGQLGAELGRWSFFNDRLDEIERTLPPPGTSSPIR